MSSELAIRARSLVKSFPIYSKPHHRLLQMFSGSARKRWCDEFVALRGVDIEVRCGETVGIVGRNGSGKSTLLQVICGTLVPNEGEVQVNGRVAALLELGAGFNPEFTGRENIYLNGSILGLTREEVHERFDDIVDFSEIGEFIDQPVKTYSSGMYVRLAFAVAINVTPDILIVDEALSVGDEAFQRKCFSRIESIRAAGATVLFVSHSAGTVVELCDRAILLDHGEVLAVGSPKEIISQYQRLLYAPADKVASIRQQIVSGQKLVGSPEVDVVETDLTEVVEPESEASLEAYWDEGLRPTSTIAYESRGAEIMGPCIETISGRRVNVLAPKEEYVYTYRVRFDQGVAGVRCGMMIKSITGIEVGGAATATIHDPLPWMDAGTEILVRFRFRCLLASGTYFLNAGVLGMMEGLETYLDRRIDVAMFRVMPRESSLATGLVDLDVSSQIIASDA
ncbi:ABC transporter ATP-binding protein [Pseudoxanthomonas sp. SL93]|jgi:lipopolysaccharide transport system ATP-binding protein|uniref:ABC transporter ATP-binding protein n=1 Tax=Pseudoxanthomonas sp. SL93 TaxID=2995142 RepID=UPI00226EC5A6|nr:ABC transporter ATP-binding protein [Pseudoxanthomonas sp. SL93]WAC63027.1 ABC transporter ATP-binding protein [Pseudoxanthomonas sp. SL93]